MDLLIWMIDEWWKIALILSAALMILLGRKQKQQARRTNER